MGALIAGVYATGKLDVFREWMKTVNKKKMLELTDFSLSINHLVKGNRTGIVTAKNDEQKTEATKQKVQELVKNL